MLYTQTFNSELVRGETPNHNHPTGSPSVLPVQHNGISHKINIAEISSIKNINLIKNTCLIQDFSTKSEVFQGKMKSYLFLQCCYCGTELLSFRSVNRIINKLYSAILTVMWHQ